MLLDGQLPATTFPGTVATTPRTRMAEWIAVSIAASLPQDMPSTASGAPGSSSCKIARAEKKYSREMARSWSGSLGRAKYATDRAATPCHEGHLVPDPTGPSRNGPSR